MSMRWLGALVAALSSVVLLAMCAANRELREQEAECERSGGRLAKLRSGGVACVVILRSRLEVWL